MTTSSKTGSPKPVKKRAFSIEMQKKLAITVVVIMLALFALIYRLYRIQDEYSEEYNQKILSQQKYDSRDIPYRRGDITDRNGTFLATSTKVYNLILDPSQINSDTLNYLEPTIALLNEVFGYDGNELRSTIAERFDAQYIRYDKQLSYDQMMQFEDRKTEINNQYKAANDPHRVYGVWFEDAYMRYYPNDSLACNVIGFSISDGTEGSGGIEQYYNSELTGINGREYGYLNDDSNLERVIKPAEDGNTLVSTIDANVQSIVEKYIKQWELETGSKTAACVVMDPKTGEILAMTSNRQFDLNNPRDLSRYYTESEIATMTDAQKSTALNQMWRNFCVSDTYEPGSVSKIFTVAGALEEGVISGSETYMCDGYEDIGGWIIRCNNRNGHGLLTVEESLMQSCNDAMMQISAATGKERFMKYLNLFGFGTKTGIDLPGEADTSTLVHSAADMVSSDLATNAFGQNFNCTMVQMAAAYCSVINGGYYYAPHVVKQILNSEGSVVKNVTPKVVSQTVSESTTEFINHALFRTVEEGTGGAAIIEGYEIAGKTGTAEKYPRDKHNYVVSFSGYAPANDPQVLCYVIVDEPHVEDQAHATYATGIFRNIMNDILPYLNIFREGDYEYEMPDSLTRPDGVTPEEGEEVTEETVKEYEHDEYIQTNPEVPEDTPLPGVPAGLNSEGETVEQEAPPVEETLPAIETVSETIEAFPQ